MANDQIPNDPYREPIREPMREPMPGDDMRSPAQMDYDLQPDPELAEGRASGGRIALFAVAIAVVLGAVFYGLNNSNVEQARTVTPTQTAQTQSAPPPATPQTNQANNTKPNAQPGVTTGSASTNRPTPPAAAPTGPELDRSANPSAGQNNDTK